MTMMREAIRVEVNKFYDVLENRGGGPRHHLFMLPHLQWIRHDEVRQRADVPFPTYSDGDVPGVADSPGIWVPPLLLIN